MVGLSVCLFVCLSVMTVSPAKMAELIEMPFRLWTWVASRNHVLDGVQISAHEGKILWVKRWLDQDKPGHIQQLICSKRLSRGQHRYGADSDCSVLDGDAHWRHLSNTFEPSVCGGNTASCQITLTTCSFFTAVYLTHCRCMCVAWERH